MLSIGSDAARIDHQVVGAISATAAEESQYLFTAELHFRDVVMKGTI
jgi:hypothetical protein